MYILSVNVCGRIETKYQPSNFTTRTSSYSSTDKFLQVQRVGGPNIAFIFFIIICLVIDVQWYFKFTTLY